MERALTVYNSLSHTDTPTLTNTHSFSQATTIRLDGAEEDCAAIAASVAPTAKIAL
jgi:hypothetical protein